MDEDISHLIQNFRDLSSIVQETRDSANESILGLIQSDPMQFLFLSAQIIRMDELPDSIYRMAITLMDRTLTPSLQVSIQTIQSVFLDPANSDKRKTIKEAAFRGLMFTDQTIRQQASQCINLILQVETDKWSELFPSLLEVANPNSTQYSTEAHCGAIYCFRNIIQSNIPFKLYEDFLENCFSLAHNIISSTSTDSEALFDESFECYISILDQLVDKSAINDEISSKCFEVLEQSMSKYGLTKLKYYLSALLSILKGVYSTSVFDYLGKYLEFTKQVLEDGNFDQQISMIIWWGDIANFEFKQEKEEKRDIIESILEDFFPIITKVISVGFQSIDDFDDIIYDMAKFKRDSCKNEISRQALNAGHNCLSSFYKVAHEKMLTYVSGLWNSESFSDENNILVALLSLQSIIKKDPFYDKLYNFLVDDIKEIVMKLIFSDNIYISVSSLILIYKSISEFNCFINSPEEIDSLVTDLLSCSEKNSYRIKYCCDIIYVMCRNAKKRVTDGYETMDTSLVSKSCDQIANALNYYISQTSSTQNIQSSFVAFTMFIAILPNDEPHLSMLPDIQENIVKKTIEQTLSNSEEFSEENLFLLQNSMINIIDSMASRLSLSQIKLQDADEMIQILFALKNQKKTAIYEETLTAISSIILNIKEDYAPYIEETMDMILVMLETGSSNIIQRAINTVSDLFRSLSSYMKGYTSPVFKLMIPMIYEGNLDRDLIFSIIYTLADVTKSITDINADDKTEFFKVVIQLSNSVVLDPKDKTEIMFINHYFESVFYALSIIIDCSMEEQLLEGVEYDKTFEPIITTFLKMKIDYDIYTINNCLSLIKSLANLYKRSISIKINGRKIRGFVDYYRKNSTNKDLMKNAQEVYDVISEL